MIVLAEGDSERRRTISIGLRDPLEHTATWAEIELPARWRGAWRPAAGPRATGTTIALWGPAGAPGRTSVATAIAAELAAVGKRVVLADVDTHAASVAPMLGLFDEAPGFRGRLPAGRAATLLDAAELDRIAETAGGAAGGVPRLTGLGRPSRWPELDRRPRGQGHARVPGLGGCHRARPRGEPRVR